MSLFDAVLAGGGPEVVDFWDKADGCGTTGPRDEVLGIGVVAGVETFVCEVVVLILGPRETGIGVA